MQRSSGLALLLVSSSPAWTQDLLDRGSALDRAGGAEVATYAGRDRLDLKAGARIPALRDRDAGSSRLGLQGGIESDFACGRFDVAANLRSLISKEAAEDFAGSLLGAVEGELAYNALMLLAEASPTAFQLFQHMRVNANALLGINYNRCAAIEEAVSDGLQGIRARAIKDCIAEKQAQGLSMDEALRACERSDEIRSITGERVKAIDLGEEIKKGFQISDVEFSRLERLLQRVRITPSGASGEVKAEPVIEEYRRLERDYYRAWLDLTNRLAKDPKTAADAQEMKKLGPEWAPRPLPAELREIALLPENERRILLENIARQAALLDLTVLVQRLERWLAAEAQNPELDEARVRLREQEVRELRRQILHLDELARRQAQYNAALLSLGQVGRRYQAKEVTEELYREGTRAEAERYFEKIPEWGALPGRQRATSLPSTGTKAPTIQGRGCTEGHSSCGGFGRVNEENK